MHSRINHCLIIVASAIALVSALSVVASRRHPAVAKAAFANIIVTTTADENGTNPGACSLREAITAANANTVFGGCMGGPGADTIQFNIGSGTPTIALFSPLPTIAESVVINGNSGGATRVSLNGDGAGASTVGLNITGGNSTLQSLVIRDFRSDGIRLGSGGNTVQNCSIGLDESGSGAAGNLNHGILITGANNTIGGATAGLRNVISGNGVDGISIDGAAATGNIVQGNYLGTDAAGTADRGNGQRGMSVFNEANGTQILGNVISGNDLYALDIAFGTSNCVIQGNLIGTDATGMSALGNLSGLLVNFSSNNNLIGGVLAAERNVISANGFLTPSSGGIAIVNDSNGNLVRGNYIGLNAAGSGALGNNDYGIVLGATALNNSIGGMAAGAGNRIAFNAQKGIYLSDAVGVPASTGNSILGNEIFSNGALGLDLNDDGVTPNDAGDGDGGPNNLQNFPVLTAIVTTPNAVTIQGTLNSTANTTFRIEFFANPACDASGNGEGQTFLGATNVTTVGNNATINVTLPVPVAAGQTVTATATDPAGNTSEFSACATACAYALTPTVASFTAAAATGMFTVTTGAGCAWTAVSNAPWLIVTGGASGTGNGTVTYFAAANPDASLRVGAITVAGNTFTVTQTGTTGLIIDETFSGPFPPPGWDVIDGGTGNGSWKKSSENPCPPPGIGPPFTGTFALVDANCAGPTTMLDESLLTPQFNATGLGAVFLEFFNQFQWNAVAPNNVGDVDVSTDGGVEWTNALKLQGQDFGVPTPETRNLNLTPFIGANRDKVRVRLRYHGSGAPMRPTPNAPTGEQFVYWAADFTIYGFGINPTSRNHDGGGTGTVAVVAANRAWTAVSNVSWITIIAGGSGSGNGTVSYRVDLRGSRIAS